MDTQKARSELIKIAADLLLMHDLPSSNVDDYPQKQYSANRVASMMEAAHDKNKEFAIRIRQVADLIK